MNLSAASPFASLATAGGTAAPMAVFAGTAAPGAFASALLGTADAIVPPPAAAPGTFAAAMPGTADTIVSPPPAGLGAFANLLGTADAIAPPLADAPGFPAGTAIPDPVLARSGPMPPTAPLIGSGTALPPPASPLATDMPAQPATRVDGEIVPPASVSAGAAPPPPATTEAPAIADTPEDVSPEDAPAEPVIPTLVPAAPIVVAPAIADKAVPASSNRDRPNEFGKVRQIAPSPAGDLIEQPAVCRPETDPVAAIEPTARNVPAVALKAVPKPEPGIAANPESDEPLAPSDGLVTPPATETTSAAPVSVSEVAPIPQSPAAAPLAAASLSPTAPSVQPERHVADAVLPPAVPPTAANPADSQIAAGTPDAPPSATIAATAENAQPVAPPRAPGTEDVAGRSFAQHIPATGAPDTAEAPPAPPAPRPAEPEVAARPGRIGQEMGVVIARHVSTNAGETMTVRLTPADMGRIDVRLSFDESGTLRAVVAADNPASLEMLRRDSADLTRALSDAGVRADGASLRFDTRSDGGGGSAGQFWQRRQDARTAASDRAADQPLPDDTPYRPLRASGRIDMMA